MDKPICAAMPRREFLTSAPIWTLGTYFWCRILDQDALGLFPQTLPEELSAEELKIVEQSALAKDLLNYFGKGYSCAESMLMVGLRYLKKPEELIWIAAGFGGGMSHRDVCGVVTGGLMILGLAAGMSGKERKEAKEWNKQKVDAFWEWWISQAPLRCADIRKEGTTIRICQRLGNLAAAKIEELMGPAFPS
jgi:C_GCAxxG_C_C family probable redox protein